MEEEEIVVIVFVLCVEEELMIMEVFELEVVYGKDEEFVE